MIDNPPKPFSKFSTKPLTQCWSRNITIYIKPIQAQFVPILPGLLDSDLTGKNT